MMRRVHPIDAPRRRRRRTRTTTVVGVLTGLALPLLAQAQSLDIKPITPTVLVVADDASARVQYAITNASAMSRSLVMVAIPGIAPDPLGAGACAVVFTLAASQSCILDLRIDGASLGAGHTGGPVICRAQPSGSPDLVQCFRPAAASELDITVVPGLLDDGFEASDSGR